MEIAAGVHLFGDGHVNWWAVEQGQRLTLIDSAVSPVCREDALPVRRMASAIARTTSSSTGVVAAWSRYVACPGEVTSVVDICRHLSNHPVRCPPSGR